MNQEIFNCPKCGRRCGREEAHNGIAMLYGPWGCYCGWSEDSQYDRSAGQSGIVDGGIIDQWGMMTVMDESEVYGDRQCVGCGGEGQVPTADYESYLGAMMKPCPVCHGVTNGLGHGTLS